MNCPNCNYDLFELEVYSNINESHNCPKCNTELLLEYEEQCSEDFEDCWPRI